MTVRQGLIALDIAAVVIIVAVVAYRVLSLRRNPDERPAQNARDFYDDKTLETTRLERVLKWCLFCSVVIALALPLYWLREPTRQDEATHGFDKAAIQRGATLFANEQSPNYNAALSLKCADCHGLNGEGGSTSYVLNASDTGLGHPVQVTWTAPPLNTVLLRFSAAEVDSIITYGRANTPMPAWGVEGGGPKDDQSISDIVAYLGSIQISPAKAKAQEQEQYAEQLSNAQQNLATAQQNLTQAEQTLAAATTPKARADAVQQVQLDQQAVANSQSWVTTVSAALQNGLIGQGELLFMQNCARCHTKGWSYFEPSDASVPLPGPMGGGAFGPNLTNGDTLRQFPQVQQQIDWVTTGADAQKAYGVRGISSGRMPFFSDMLTPQQIQAIVAYERSL